VPRESNQYRARIERHGAVWGIRRFDSRPGDSGSTSVVLPVVPPARTGEAPGGTAAQGRRNVATPLCREPRVCSTPAPRVVGRNAARHWWLTEPRCRPEGERPYATAVDSVGVLLEAERNRKGLPIDGSSGLCKPPFCPAGEQRVCALKKAPST